MLETINCSLFQQTRKRTGEVKSLLGASDVKLTSHRTQSACGTIKLGILEERRFPPLILIIHFDTSRAMEL